MTTTDCPAHIEQKDRDIAADPGAPPAQEHASKPLKGLFFAFAATVTVGLVLTSWYLGVRIVTADETSPSIAAQPRAVVNLSPEPAPAPIAKPVDLYLQSAGLGPKQDARFVRSLEARGFHAQVEMPAGPASIDARILIGPFDTRSELEQAQQKLAADGVLAIESSH